MSHQAPFLELNAVSKHYGDVVAVNCVSLQLARNEFITLLGPSGCGKTTILRMIAGFVQPTAGEIQLQGTTISSSTRNLPPEKREFGMVFQSFAIWPHMTVGQNVELPLRLRGITGSKARSRRDESLDLCRLACPADNSKGSLWQERSSIGRNWCCSTNH